jgi:hypothetical protein
MRIEPRVSPTPVVNHSSLRSGHPPTTVMLLVLSLLEEFNSFKQLANENSKSMYSRLNVLLNEINALGVKDITDLNFNCTILQSLRKPDYDLVKAIIYEKKLEELKPSHILSKIMAHELQIMPKSKKAPQEKP